MDKLAKTAFFVRSLPVGQLGVALWQRRHHPCCLGVHSSKLKSGYQCVNDANKKVHTGQLDLDKCEKADKLPQSPYYSYGDGKQCYSTSTCFNKVRSPVRLLSLPFMSSHFIRNEMNACHHFSTLTTSLRFVTHLWRQSNTHSLLLETSQHV